MDNLALTAATASTARAWSCHCARPETMTAPVHWVLRSHLYLKGLTYQSRLHSVKNLVRTLTHKEEQLLRTSILMGTAPP